MIFIAFIAEVILHDKKKRNERETIPFAVLQTSKIIGLLEN